MDLKKALELVSEASGEALMKRRGHIDVGQALVLIREQLEHKDPAPSFDPYTPPVKKRKKGKKK